MTSTSTSTYVKRLTKAERTRLRPTVDAQALERFFDATPPGFHRFFFLACLVILPPTRSPLSGSKSPPWFQLDGTERWVDCLAANSRRCGSRWTLPPMAPNKRLKLAARVD